MIFKVLMNLGAVIEIFRAFEKIGVQIWREKKLPACGESIQLLEAIKKLMKSGLLKVPGYDVGDVVKAISDIEGQLQCKD